MKYAKNCVHFLLLLILCNQIDAQVSVREEPHHKPVLENDYVRLLDVHINPGDTTFYHIHATPSVIVFISQSITGAQKMGEAPARPTEVKPGNTLFVDYGTNPITHRVFNAGKNVFHVMDIELAKKEPSPDSCSPIQQSDVQTTINEKLVRVYKFDVAAHQSFHVAKTSCAHLLVCISGDITAGKNITTGEYVFVDPNTDISIKNTQTENATCVMLELK